MQETGKVISIVELKAVRMFYICSGFYAQDNYFENSV